MKQIKAILSAAFVVVFVIAGAAIASTPADAAMIKASAICKKGSGFCIKFGDTGTIPGVVSMTFVAPTAGTALVSFNGSMSCLNHAAEDDKSHGVVDLTSQITTDATPPNYQAPGGSRSSMRLPPFTTADLSVAVNLASSRVANLTKGSHTFVFKVARNRMDPFTICTVFNGDFNLVFVP